MKTQTHTRYFENMQAHSMKLQYFLDFWSIRYTNHYEGAQYIRFLLLAYYMCLNQCRGISHNFAISLCPSLCCFHAQAHSHKMLALFQWALHFALGAHSNANDCQRDVARNRERSQGYWLVKIFWPRTLFRPFSHIVHNIKLVIAYSTFCVVYIAKSIFVPSSFLIRSLFRDCSIHVQTETTSRHFVSFSFPSWFLVSIFHWPFRRRFHSFVVGRYFSFFFVTLHSFSVRIVHLAVSRCNNFA